MDQLSTELQRQPHIHDKNQQGSVRELFVYFSNRLCMRNLYSFASVVKDIPVVAYVFLRLLITRVSRV